MVLVYNLKCCFLRWTFICFCLKFFVQFILIIFVPFLYLLPHLLISLPTVLGKRKTVFSNGMALGISTSLQSKSHDRSLGKHKRDSTLLCVLWFDKGTSKSEQPSISIQAVNSTYTSLLLLNTRWQQVQHLSKMKKFEHDEFKIYTESTACQN